MNNLNPIPKIPSYYPGMMDDMENVRKRCNSAREIGDLEEYNRLIRENLYEIHFNQRSYLIWLHKNLREMELFSKTKKGREYLQHIRERIKRDSKFLYDWGENFNELLENYNRIQGPAIELMKIKLREMKKQNTPQLNGEENK